MGGLIAVGVLEKDGTLTTVTGHTNPLPRIMKTEAFANGDFSGIREYIENYGGSAFGIDFGKRSNTPIDYGYVLFDLRENKVLASQNYSNLHLMLAAEITMVALKDIATADGKARILKRRRDWSDARQESVPVEIERFRDFKHFLSTPDALHVPGSGTTVAGHMFPMSQQYDIEYPAWQVVDLDRNEENYATLRDYLDARGLISSAERDRWNEEIETIRREKAEMAALEAAPSPSP